MKNLHIAIIVAVCVWTNVVDCKKQRLNYQIKKATTHLKPTKGSKSLLETFKTLPADDFEFIKQLDKQFNQFGNNVKIKLQKENRTTATGKNIKRTIDGSLGYGYQKPNDQQMMYSFSKPKYEIYPYSQHDIAPSSQYQQHQHQHQLHYLRNYPMALVESDPDYFRKQQTNGHTSVEIQPSHSYEIKQHGHGYNTVYNGNGDEQSQDYGGHDEAVPVIVLRYNGPAKYASHLQILLQQYLEARTAQYIQEQEAHGIDDSQQIHDQEQHVNAYGALPVLAYGQQTAYVPAQHSVQMFIQPVQPIQPFFSQPLPNPYANAHIAQPIDIGADHVVATPAPANYYTPTAHSDETDDQHSGIVHPTAYEYHNVHDEQQQQQQHSVHDTHSNEEVIYGQPHQESVSDHDALLTTENFPDDKHTQVYFKSSTQSPYQTDDHYSQQISQQYLPQTYRAPLVYHKYEEESYYPQGGDQGDGYSGYDDNAQPIVASTPYTNTVAITQRPAILPHNYHADLNDADHYNNGYNYSTESTEDNNLYKRNSNRKRQSTQSRDDQMKKFKRLANRMKSRMTATKQTNSQQVQV